MIGLKTQHLLPQHASKLIFSAVGGGEKLCSDERGRRQSIGRPKLLELVRHINNNKINTNNDKQLYRAGFFFVHCVLPGLSPYFVWVFVLMYERSSSYAYAACCWMSYIVCNRTTTITTTTTTTTTMTKTIARHNNSNNNAHSPPSFPAGDWRISCWRRSLAPSSQTWRRRRTT